MIKVRNGKAASSESLRTLELSLGYKISHPFSDFVKVNDGAEPENNRFEIDDHNGAGVNGFIPIDKIPKERAFLDPIPAEAYPIAWASCGNYVYLDEGQGGAVYFWDHELPDQPTKLADSFNSFLELLKPDGDAPKLKPGQVISAWIDPEFLKKIREQGG